jgi:hypothetical protein
MFMGFYEHSVKIKKKYVSRTTQNFGQLFCKWTHSALDTIPSQFNHIPRATNATKIQTDVPHHLLFGLANRHFTRKLALRVCLNYSFHNSYFIDFANLVTYCDVSDSPSAAPYNILKFSPTQSSLILKHTFILYEPTECSFARA